MSYSNEFDKYFDHLKKVERSKEVKSKTLDNILNSTNRKDNLQRKQRFKVTAVSLMSALIAIFLLVIYIDEREVKQSGDGVEIEATQILIAKSASDKTFKATSISNSITIENDATFKNEIEKLFKHIKILPNPHTYNTPAFDMTVRQENGNPFKMKIWEHEGSIYLYDFEEDQYYESTHGSAFNVYKMMSNISHLQ